MSTVCTNDQTIPLKANGQVDWVTIIPLHIFDQRLQSPYYNSTQYYVHAKDVPPPQAPTIPYSPLCMVKSCKTLQSNISTILLVGYCLFKPGIH